MSLQIKLRYRTFQFLNLTNSLFPISGAMCIILGAVILIMDIKCPDTVASFLGVDSLNEFEELYLSKFYIPCNFVKSFDSLYFINESCLQVLARLVVKKRNALKLPPNYKNSKTVFCLSSKSFFNMSIRFSPVTFRPFWAKVFVKLMTCN